MKITIDPDVLEDIRQERGIPSYRQMADRIGISGPYLSQIRNGVRGISVEFIAGMYVWLGIPFELGPGSLYRRAEEA